MSKFHFKFCAEGELNVDQTAVFTVSVKEASQGLTLTPDGGALPDQTVGTAVSDEVTVISGGTPPYTFSVSEGALPDGEDLFSEDNPDGSTTLTLEGTPTTAGDDSFTLDVSDSAVPPATAKVKAAVKSAPAKAAPKVKITKH